MQKIGGCYYRENFHRTKCYLSEDENPSFGITNSRSTGEKADVERDDFVRFVDEVWVEGDDTLEYFHHYTKKNLLVSLTALNLYKIHLSKNKFPGLIATSNNIETIEIVNSDVEDDIFGQFLAS